MKGRRMMAALAIAASLVVATPIAATAAPVAQAAPQVVSMGCGYQTRYHWDWFQCWAIFYAPPSSCYYRVYTCS